MKNYNINFKQVKIADTQGAVAGKTARQLVAGYYDDRTGRVVIGFIDGADELRAEKKQALTFSLETPLANLVALQYAGKTNKGVKLAVMNRRFMDFGRPQQAITELLRVVDQKVIGVGSPDNDVLFAPLGEKNAVIAWTGEFSPTEALTLKGFEAAMILEDTSTILLISEDGEVCYTSAPEIEAAIAHNAPFKPGKVYGLTITGKVISVGRSRDDQVPLIVEGSGQRRRVMLKLNFTGDAVTGKLITEASEVDKAIGGLNIPTERLTLITPTGKNGYATVAQNGPQFGLDLLTPAAQAA